MFTFFLAAQPQSLASQLQATSSHVDPALELGRGYTNWGMTPRRDERPPRKTWATATVAAQQAEAAAPASDADISRPSTFAGTTRFSPSADASESGEQPPPHRHTPPRDPHSPAELPSRAGAIVASPIEPKPPSNGGGANASGFIVATADDDDDQPVCGTPNEKRELSSARML